MREEEGRGQERGERREEREKGRSGDRGRKRGSVVLCQLKKNILEVCVCVCVCLCFFVCLRVCVCVCVLKGGSSALKPQKSHHTHTSITMTTRQTDKGQTNDSEEGGRRRAGERETYSCHRRGVSRPL